MAAEPVIRSEVIFQGHVQGVGFRYTTQTTAQSYDVVGYVQNLPDGRVKLVAEGSTAEIDRFLADLGRRMEGHIQSQSRTDLAATGEFLRFSVRH
jgi:acylphosphatase